MDKQVRTPTWVDEVAQEGILKIEGITSLGERGKQSVQDALFSLDEELQVAKDYQEWSRNFPHPVALKDRYRLVDKIENNSPIRPSASSVFPLKDGRIVSADTTRPVTFWSKENGTWKEQYKIREFSVATKPITKIQVDASGALIALDSSWSLSIFAEISPGAWTALDCFQQKFKSILDFQLLPNGDLFCVHLSGKVGLWKITSDALEQNKEWQIQDARLTCLQLMPNGGVLIGGEDGFLACLTRAGDNKYKIEKCIAEELKQENFRSVQMLPDGNVATLSQHGTVRIFHKAEGRTFNKFLAGEDLEGIASTWDYVTLAYDVTTMQCLGDGRLLTLQGQERFQVWVPTAIPADEISPLFPNLFHVPGDDMNVYQWIPSPVLHTREKFLDFKATIDGRIIASNVDSSIHIYDDGPFYQKARSLSEIVDLLKTP